MATNRARQIATGLLLALALAGCSSTGSGTGSGSVGNSTAGKTTASTPATKPAAAPAQGKLDGVPKTCPAANEVMSNLNLSALVVEGDDPSICRYNFHGDTKSPYAAITFNSAPGFTPAMLEGGLTKEQSSVKPVSGLADAAFTFTPSGGDAGVGLSFLSGDTICSIVTTVPTTAAGEIALAKAILQG